MTGEQIPPLDLDDKSQGEIVPSLAGDLATSSSGEKQEKQTKHEQFLNLILPMMIITRLADTFIEKIHSKVNHETKGLSKTFFIALGDYITSEYEKVYFTLL